MKGYRPSSGRMRPGRRGRGAGWRTQILLAMLLGSGGGVAAVQIMHRRVTTPPTTLLGQPTAISHIHAERSSLNWRSIMAPVYATSWYASTALRSADDVPPGEHGEPDGLAGPHASEEAGVIGDQAIVIHGQLGAKVPEQALVEIACLVLLRAKMSIPLRDRGDCEVGDVDVGDRDIRCRAQWQGQAPDRQGIREGRRRDVDLRASAKIRQGLAVRGRPLAAPVNPLSAQKGRVTWVLSVD